MRRTICLSALVGFLASVAGTSLTIMVILPSVVQAQGTQIRPEGFIVVGAAGTERARLTSGPGVTAGLTLLAADGETTRATVMTGGRAGDNEAGVGVNLFATNGNQLARLGTVVATEAVGSNLILLDEQGRPRIHLLVDLDGTPSITLLDELGTPIWAVPE